MWLSCYNAIIFLLFFKGASSSQIFGHFDEDLYEIIVEDFPHPNCTCGHIRSVIKNKIAPRIYGGEVTKVNEYPFMVFIKLFWENEWIHNCGGAIITQRHVITAGHCSQPYDESTLQVVVGEHDHTTPLESMFTRTYNVSKKIVHENYLRDGLGSDISIVITSEEIKLNDGVGRICLPIDRLNFEGEILRVMGWGQTEFGYDSNVLKEVDLRVVPIDECAAKLKKCATISVLNRTQHCTYSAQKDSCLHDSGGPLAWLDPATNLYVLAGVISCGDDCAAQDIPGVNVDVTSFIPWIQQKLTESVPWTGGQREYSCSII